jgi:hypothetical protein
VSYALTASANSLSIACSGRVLKPIKAFHTESCWSRDQHSLVPRPAMFSSTTALLALVAAAQALVVATNNTAVNTLACGTNPSQLAIAIMEAHFETHRLEPTPTVGAAATTTIDVTFHVCTIRAVRLSVFVSDPVFLRTFTKPRLRLGATSQTLTSRHR